MSKEKKSASGAKKEKLKKVNEVEDALPQDAEQKLTLIEDATESTAEKAEVAVKQAEKLGGKDAYEKLKALIAEMEVPEKTKEVFQKSLEDFTNLKNNIANNAQDKDLLIKEIDGIINKLNTKIEILTKTESTENPADSVSIEVNPDAPEPEKEPKPKKTRTRTKKETPTENTAPAEALKVGDTVELDPTITTPPVVAVAPDAPGAPEPIKTEAEITDKINQEIAQAEAQRLNEGKKPLTNYDKWQIAIKLMPPSDKELERRNNPGTRQKIENWWLGKNTDRASKLSLAATKAFIIGGTALLTNDVSHLGKGAWRVANSVATSYLGDTKAVKDLIGVVAGKYENLNKRQKLMAKGAVALAAGLAVGGGVALGAVTATGAGIGLAGAGARFGINKLFSFMKKMALELDAKAFDINNISQNFDEVTKEFRRTQRFLEYMQSFSNLLISSAIADASAKHYLDEHYEKQSHEIEEEIKKMETAEPTVDDIDSEMSQLKNQISHMGADEKETSDLLKEKFNTLSNEKHSLIQEQESPASRNSSDAETITVADHPVENSNENENLFSTKNLAGAWKVNDPQHEVEKVIPGDTPTIEKKIPVTGSTVVEEENNVQKPSPEKTEIKGTAKESLPSETPKVKEISGMDPKFVVDKGLGVTHAFREQVGADAKLGSALADQIGYEGKVGTPAFYKALGQHFGYIDKNGDEVRVKWGGKGGMAAYEFVKDAKGNYEVKESHLVGNNWENTETNKDGMEFEGKTEDNIENPKYNPKETHDYEYLHERKVRGPILKETNGPKETIPTGPKQEEIIPVAKKEEVLLKEEVVSRPEPAPKERVRIVRQAPQGNGLVKAGYMVGGDYMANADYGARGDNTSPYPNFPGGMPPGMEMYNFTPEEIRDIQMEAGSLSEGRSVVLQKMMMNVARNPNMGPNLPVIVYQDIALKGETEMNADLNKIINGGGSYLENKEWNEMQGNRVAKFVEDNLNTPGDKGQLAKYIRNLENASGLEPKEGFVRHEKVGEFIRRAHADLAIKEMRGEFDYRNLSVPGEVKAPAIEAEANEAGDESNNEESNENTNQAEKIDFNKTEMYELWDTYTNDPSALTEEGRDFAGKVASLRRQLGSSFPSIGNSETAQHYLDRLEKAANK